MAMLSNKLQYLGKKNKKFLSRSSSHKSSRREEKRKLDISLLNAQTCRKTNPKTNLRSQSSNPTNSRSKSRRA